MSACDDLFANPGTKSCLCPSCKKNIPVPRACECPESGLNPLTMDNCCFIRGSKQPVMDVHTRLLTGWREVVLVI